MGGSNYPTSSLNLKGGGGIIGLLESVMTTGTSIVEFLNLKDNATAQ